MALESLKKLNWSWFSFTKAAYVSAILGIMQGIIVLGMSWYFSEFYLNDNIPQLLDYPLWALITRASTIDFDNAMKGLTVATALFDSIWLASCFGLVAGNYFQYVLGITQWVVVTLFITLLDIIFFIYFVSQTWDMLGGMLSFDFNSKDAEHVTKGEVMDGYLMLLFTLGKGGPLLWILNIILAYLCYRRASQILSAPKMEDSSYITLGPKLNGNGTATKSPFQSNIKSDVENTINMSNASVTKGYNSDGVY